jgi:MacB-like periplasmic core domain
MFGDRLHLRLSMTIRQGDSNVTPQSAGSPKVTSPARQNAPPFTQGSPWANRRALTRPPPVPNRSGFDLAESKLRRAPFGEPSCDPLLDSERDVEIRSGSCGNAAIFSVVRAVLLRPLPYPAPERLMLVAPGTDQSSVTIPEFEFWRANTPVFAAAAGFRGVSERSLAAGSRQESVQALTITDDFFRTLAVPLALGREFTNAEMHPSAPQTLILGTSCGSARSAEPRRPSAGW